MYFHRSEIGMALIVAAAVRGLFSVASPTFAADRDLGGRVPILTAAGTVDVSATEAITAAATANDTTRPPGSMGAREGSHCGRGKGDCCVEGGNGTRGCEDVDCCKFICDLDPFCCDAWWDGICADLAQDLCEICQPIRCEDDSDCDDGDDCTLDSCNVDTDECVFVEVDCDDGNPCTIDSCNADTGQCTHEKLDCGDGVDCTFDSCDVDTGKCNHEPVDCDDEDPCTDDSCDPDTAECQYVDNGACCEGCGTCDGDVNCDGLINPLDSGAVLARFGMDPCNEENCRYDVNCDGKIDPLDSGYILGRFGTCVPPEGCTRCVFHDNCREAPVDVLPGFGETLTYHGANANATMTCAALGFPETWHAFSLKYLGEVTTSLCGTHPPFANASMVLVPECPCSGEFIFAFSFEQSTCDDGNWTMHYPVFSPGTYYTPVLMDETSSGKYTWNITLGIADFCGEPNAGDCCVANRSPGCEDEACCEAICADDPFCCEFEWDRICSDAAQGICEVCSS